eukprot:TRINITY_DN2897_c0_g2_i1.p1 TRINITY_DN2897_c0_g2~~TRINITY_DN2897_c0_g2_i1.p1  ORF type:complete len:1028 (+),score=195.42 TRINITY_DN2897_c0_g2_i1:31-3114(+)
MGDLTLDTFKQWTKDCGVKKVQAEYEELAKAAVANKKTLQEEMKDRGFKDFNAFSKQCHRFSTFCWPLEFRELGSGYVMYFQFLWFLMAMFFLFLGLQAPAMALYAENADLGDWEWHDWQKAWGEDDAACKCVGDNGTGATCGAWDSNRDLQSMSRPGQWVCYSWCYADKYCPTIKASKLVEQNVRMASGKVKAYSSCTQNDTLIAECKADPRRSAEISYDESDVLKSGRATFIGTGYLTPGNLGPDESENALIPVMYMVCVVVLCTCILLAYSSQVLTDHKVDAGCTSPSDFAIMVKGMPVTATDEEEVMEFFKKNAVKGKEDIEIAKVVIGWDVDEFRENIRSLKALSDELQEREDQKDEKSMQLKQEIVKITHALKSAGGKDTKLKSSGVVVVTFRYQSDLRACLNRWTSFWARWFYADAEDFCCCCCCWKNNNLRKGGELARYPIGGRPVAKLKVMRAPEPGDINWAELAVPRKLRTQRLLYTNGVMLLLVLVCFGAVYGLRKVQEVTSGSSGGLDSGSGQIQNTGPWPGIAAGLVVAIVNGLLMAAAKKLGDKEYHDTLTDQEFSQALKMSIGMIVNTAGVILFMYTQPAEWYMTDGLVQSAFTMLVINAIIPPIVPYLDFGYSCVKRIKRRSLTQEKIDEMNETKKSLKDPKSQEAKELIREIEGFKKAFAPGRMNMLRRYAQALKVFVCCLLYMPVVPFLSLVGLLGLLAQYWIDKYLLLHWHQRPEKPASADMANLSVMFIKYTCPVGFSLAVFIFLTPSYSNKGVVLSSFLISLAISSIFSFLFPLSVWIRCWLSLPCNEITTVGELDEDYYQAQHMWSKEMKYHKDQFIYKRLPEDKNPEMLQAGHVVAMKADDAKASYGASAEAAADEAAHGGPGRMALKGGRVAPGMASSDSLGGGGGGGGGGAPAAIYGAPTVTAGPVAVTVTPVLPGCTDSDGASTKHGSRVVWEYEVHDGYARFHDDCQNYVEKKYQDFKSGGKPRVNVRTQGKNISMDFEKMTSKVEDSHKIRKIKRVETE